MQNKGTQFLANLNALLVSFTEVLCSHLIGSISFFQRELSDEDITKDVQIKTFSFV